MNHETHPEIEHTIGLGTKLKFDLSNSMSKARPYYMIFFIWLKVINVNYKHI